MRNEHVLQMNIQTFQSLLILTGKNKLSLFYVTRKDFSLKRILDWWNFLFFSFWKNLPEGTQLFHWTHFEMLDLRPNFECTERSTRRKKKGRQRWRGKKTERRIVKCDPSPKGSTHFWHKLRQVWERAWENKGKGKKSKEKKDRERPKR